MTTMALEMGATRIPVLPMLVVGVVVTSLFGEISPYPRALAVATVSLTIEKRGLRVQEIEWSSSPAGATVSAVGSECSVARPVESIAPASMIND